MNNMNFLTKEQIEKIEIEEYARKYFAIFFSIAIFFLMISFGIKQVENSIQRNINAEKTMVSMNNDKIEKLKKLSLQETNLGVKIEIIEDIFLQKNMRVSEILKSLDVNVPPNVWLQSLVYENKEVRIEGFSFSSDEIGSAEENAYYFEERMLESGLYESVSLSYLKKSTKYGEKIDEFEYVLILNDK